MPLVLPRLPAPPKRYEEENESQFRREIERTLRELINVSSGTAAPDIDPGTLATLVQTGTWVNQGTSTATADGDGYRFDWQAPTGSGFRGIVQAAPSAPYDVITRVYNYFSGASVYLIGGIYLRESGTGKVAIWGPGHYSAHDQATLVQIPGTNTTEGTRVTYTNFVIAGRALWVKVRNTGTNLQVFTSADGEHWMYHTQYTLTFNGAFTTAPDQIGLGFYAFNGTDGDHHSFFDTFRVE